MFCAALLGDKLEGAIYSNLIGKFPVRSFSGNQYVTVAYVYNANAILVRSMKSRTKEEYVEKFKEIYKYLKLRSFAPQLHVMDNECSKFLKDYLNEEEKVKIQLVEPDMHCINAAERAIQTYKNLLILGLCTVDKMFPLQLWDETLEQSEIMLNLLRTSRKSPKLSAYAQLEGPFNFNHTPLAPVGSRAILMNPPTKRGMWDPRALEAWYVGPALQHHRNWRFWVQETKGFRIGGTEHFLPTHCKVLQLTAQDEILLATKKLIYALSQKNKHAPINPPKKFYEALQKFTEIYHDTVEEQVDPNKPPDTQFTTSTDATAKTHWYMQKQLHQQTTRTNVPQRQALRVNQKLFNLETSPILKKTAINTQPTRVNPSKKKTRNLYMPFGPSIRLSQCLLFKKELKPQKMITTL